jgi:hypothetical protein
MSIFNLKPFTISYLFHVEARINHQPINTIILRLQHRVLLQRDPNLFPFVHLLLDFLEIVLVLTKLDQCYLVVLLGLFVLIEVSVEVSKTHVNFAPLRQEAELKHDVILCLWLFVDVS